MADFMRDLGSSARGIPYLGTVLGGFGVESEEERRVRQAFAKMREEIDEYRPMAQAARQQGLSNQLGLFGPVNNMLEQMYGPSARFDLDALMAAGPGQTLLGGPPTDAQGWAEQRLQEQPSLKAGAGEDLARKRLEMAHEFNTSPHDPEYTRYGTQKPLAQRDETFARQRGGTRSRVKF